MKICPKCKTKADSWIVNYCTDCGNKVDFDPDYEQVIVKVFKYSDPEKRGFKHTPIEFDPRDIVQVWAVPYTEATPILPMALEQHRNAFYQDKVHDWNHIVIAGKHHLKYHGADNCDEYMQLIVVLKKES